MVYYFKLFNKNIKIDENKIHNTYDKNLINRKKKS